MSDLRDLVLEEVHRADSAQMSDLKACSLVCRAWLSKSQSGLFHDMYLTLNAASINQQAIVAESPHLLRHVRTISLAYHDGHHSDQPPTRGMVESSRDILQAVVKWGRVHTIQFETVDWGMMDDANRSAILAVMSLAFLRHVHLNTIFFASLQDQHQFFAELLPLNLASLHISIAQPAHGNAEGGRIRDDANTRLPSVASYSVLCDYSTIEPTSPLVNLEHVLDLHLRLTCAVPRGIYVAGVLLGSTGTALRSLTVQFTHTIFGRDAANAAAMHLSDYCQLNSAVNLRRVDFRDCSFKQSTFMRILDVLSLIRPSNPIEEIHIELFVRREGWKRNHEWIHVDWSRLDAALTSSTSPKTLRRVSITLFCCTGSGNYGAAWVARIEGACPILASRGVLDVRYRGRCPGRCSPGEEAARVRKWTGVDQWAGRSSFQDTGLRALWRACCDYWGLLLLVAIVELLVVVSRSAGGQDTHWPPVTPLFIVLVFIPVWAVTEFRSRCAYERYIRANCFDGFRRYIIHEHHYKHYI